MIDRYQLEIHGRTQDLDIQWDTMAIFFLMTNESRIKLARYRFWDCGRIFDVC